MDDESSQDSEKAHLVPSPNPSVLFFDPFGFFRPRVRWSASGEELAWDDASDDVIEAKMTSCTAGWAH